MSEETINNTTVEQGYGADQIQILEGQIGRAHV